MRSVHRVKGSCRRELVILGIRIEAEDLRQRMYSLDSVNSIALSFSFRATEAEGTEVI